MNFNTLDLLRNLQGKPTTQKREVEQEIELLLKYYDTMNTHIDIQI